MKNYNNHEIVELDELMFVRYENAPDLYGHGTQNYVGSKVKVEVSQNKVEYGYIVDPEERDLSEGTVIVEWNNPMEVFKL